jgi:hypothetical protein
MSGSTGLSPAALSDAEKADVRRFCGYPAYGGLGGAGFVGWRFFQAYGLMEFRMNNLAASEYQVVRQYLASLYQLEAAIPVAAVGNTIGVDEAGPFKRNPAEMRERKAEFSNWRRELCGFMGIPAGPSLGDSGVSFVV